LLSSSSCASLCALFFFFFNTTATTEIYTLSLHDALPISLPPGSLPCCGTRSECRAPALRYRPAKGPPSRPDRATAERDDGSSGRDRKSTRLNSSHIEISYAVFCLKKKKKKKTKNN